MTWSQSQVSDIYAITLARDKKMWYLQVITCTKNKKCLDINIEKFQP